MDTADYDTNTVLISNIASISFRIYESPLDTSHSFAATALDVENTLRRDGHLVVYDSARRGLWHFQILAQDEVNSHNVNATLDLCGHELVLVEEGLLEPASLQKWRSQQQQQPVQTPTSSRSSSSALDQAQRNGLFNLAPPGTLSTSQDQEAKMADPGIEPKPATSPHRAVYENFITALLLSISCTFCVRTGAVPLNYRTMLLVSETLEVGNPLDSCPQQCQIVATLKAYVTTTGVLVVSFALSRCRGLSSLAELVSSNLPRSGTSILAAPFGVVSNNQLSPMGDLGTVSLAQTPNTQALSLRVVHNRGDSLWKQACLKILKLRGIMSSAVADCAWVNLSVPKPRLQDAKSEAKRQQPSTATITIPWPGPLCFRKKMVNLPCMSLVGDTLRSGFEESHDPLSNARTWFNSAADRDQKASRRKADRNFALKEAQALDARPPKPSSPSPAAVRRPSAAAGGTIYPTPPDGIQHHNGVTPSMDGTLSSPGNTLSAAPANDADQGAFHASAVSDPIDIGDESKRQRSDHNLLGEADDTFGEMGGDMFGDHDITEADFSFFDEQPGGMDLDVAMADMGAATLPVVGVQEAPEAASQDKVTAQPERDDVVFAKPELKHARSSCNDAPSQRGRDNRLGPTKREASPFDPHTVFKRLRASLSTTARHHGFDTLRLDTSTIPQINRKYEQGGQFDYTKMANLEKPRLQQGALPETDYLKRHGKQGKRPKNGPFSAETFMKGLMGLESTGLQASPGRIESDDDDSSAGSDDDESCYSVEEPMSPVKSSIKLMPADDDVASQVTSLRDVESMEEPDQQLAVELPRLSKPESPELPLSLLFLDPEPLSLDLCLTDEDLIQVAQLLTDQAATGLLDIVSGQNGIAVLPATTLDSSTLTACSRNAVQVLREIVPSFLRGAAAVNLKGFLDIPDVPLLGQPTRVQPRPVPGRDHNAEPLRPSNLYQIPGPHLEVRRSEMKLSVLPSAVLFWESLGLAPSSGGKDVSAVCVFPGWTGMTDNVKAFLGCLKSVYEMLKLGSFESLALPAGLEAGALAYEVDRISTSPGPAMTGHGSALAQSMDTLLGALSSSEATAFNVVVYFIYWPSTPATIIEACIAFQRLSESYRKTGGQKDVVLQLVSANLISSPTAVVVTPAPELVKISMETYDRVSGNVMPAPAIRLEQPLPRIIDFKLTVSPSASLIRENSCIHIAYAQSVDDRWITAAWTDDRGNQQETASYCLGRRGRPASRSMNEVAHDMWELTLELISVWKVHWRVVITKCSPMDQHEIDFWAELARTEMKASVTMVLMTVDTNPSLQLLPPPVKLPYTTPVSTPPAAATATVSPEQTTDTTETESEAVLSDVTDQTWGAVVGHRLNVSLSVVDVHAALASGYLIKRTGSRLEDAPVLMEVNLVHTDASPRAYEPLLREMLSYFRGLGTLARARGVVQRETDVRPWHIAAAEKGVRALYLLM
ncbi:hypothetical protein XA68_10688 [Ophiocordyceps unilateralis]|uniref:Mediator of RNA polymerase II transcription subunit 13 n=1 Tax=Ophiocordyceps unilateralis TaxID=268505 RepID=A0A2A9PI76_OPHUN|nr:hypothetical protein XA68_10688 [Ophiocordyceps unilateralis]